MAGLFKIGRRRQVAADLFRYASIWLERLGVAGFALCILAALIKPLSERYSLPVYIYDLFSCGLRLSCEEISINIISICLYLSIATWLAAKGLGWLSTRFASSV